MPPAPWPSSFDAVLRSYLKLDGADDIDPALSLADYGVDSMTTVSLLLDLEEQYAVTIPDDQLITVVTTDVAGLWAMLAAGGACEGDDDRVPVGSGADADLRGA